MEAFPYIIQVALFEEFPQCAAPQNQETGGRQEFLEAFPFPQLEQENPELTEPVPWEDPQTFLASFEQVAKACQWPREEWVAHLLPALSGEAKKSFNELETGDREDYGKVKAAILQGDATNMEAQRQRFRQFRYQQAKDPQQIYNQLQELCHLWLKPERHTKEQILELLVLEQFLAILPQEIQNWMKDSGANARFKAMTLVEDFLSSQQEAKEWKSQEIMQEVAGSSFAEEKIPSDPPQSQIYKEAKQEGVGDLPLPSGEMMTPDCSGSVQNPDGRAVAGGGLAEGAMEVKVVVVAVDEAEQTVLDHTQGPMYWEVLKEDYEDVDFSGGVLIPKPDVFPAPGQEEIVFIQISDDRETFPGSLSAGIGNWKRDGNGNSHQRSSELRKLPEECQGMVSLRPRAGAAWPRTLLGQQSQQGNGQGELHTEGAAAATVKKGDEETNKSREVLPQQRRNELKEICHTPKKGAKSKAVVIHEEKCKSAKPQEGETQMEFIRLSEGHGSLKETTKHMWVKRLLYSQGGRIGPSGQSGLVLQKKTGRKLHPCPVCGKAFIQRNILEDHQCVHTGNKLYECPSCGKKFRWRRWVVEHQRIHTGEKPYVCSKCGKNFRWRSGLKSHRKIHLRRSSYDFSCRKSN